MAGAVRGEEEKLKDEISLFFGLVDTKPINDTDKNNSKGRR